MSMTSRAASLGPPWGHDNDSNDNNDNNDNNDDNDDNDDNDNHHDDNNDNNHNNAVGGALPVEVAHAGSPRQPHLPWYYHSLSYHYYYQ